MDRRDVMAPQPPPVPIIQQSAMMKGSAVQPQATDLNRCRTLLLYGGSFDPPHRAHIELPRLAAKQIGADCLAYIPAAVSPFKQDRRATPPEHRLAMLRLALQGVPGAIILTDELDRARDGRPSYTIDTVTALHKRHPNLTLRLLIGSDHLPRLPQWRNWQRLVKLAEPVILVRPPQTFENVLAHLPPELQPAEWAPRLAQAPLMNLSASEIRDRLRQGETISDVVCPAVADYIAEHHLYHDAIG